MENLSETEEECNFIYKDDESSPAGARVQRTDVRPLNTSSSVQMTVAVITLSIRPTNLKK